MTENNAKIHVLADETLGGIKREYVEVDRKAEVGEKIVIVESESFPKGFIGTVDEFDDYFDNGSFDLIELCEGEGFVDAEADEYQVLEPTDIVRIGGQRYELTDRKAEVGEKIVIVNADVQYEDPYNNGDIFEVESLLGCSRGIQTPCHRDIFDFEYRVLVPVEADEPQPADLIDVVANLAKEVAELKRENNERDDAIKKILSGMYDKTKRLENEIDTLHKDNRTLGEELARLKESATGVKGEKLFTADELAAIIERLLMRP